MSSTVSLSVTTAIVATKTPTGADVGNPSVGFTSGTPGGTTYNATSTPAVTVESKFTATLSTGALTIDLTALPDDVNGTVDTTGLKVNFLRLENTSTNANKIVASNGASNPYRIDGATTAWSITLAPGQVAQLELNAAGDTVASGHKTIDLAGTGSQTLKVHVALG